MSTFTFGDERAVREAIAHLKNSRVDSVSAQKYPMELNPEDLETVLRSLAALGKDRNLLTEPELGDRAASLYSSILETLGVEVV